MYMDIHGQSERNMGSYFTRVGRVVVSRAEVKWYSTAGK